MSILEREVRRPQGRSLSWRLIIGFTIGSLLGSMAAGTVHAITRIRGMASDMALVIVQTELNYCFPVTQ
jgi:hypothetical protein